MMSMDSGMLVVLIIVAMYMSIVFMLLFFVKNEWCDILNSNLTVNEIYFSLTYNKRNVFRKIRHANQSFIQRKYLCPRWNKEDKEITLVLIQANFEISHLLKICIFCNFSK